MNFAGVMEVHLASFPAIVGMVQEGIFPKLLSIGAIILAFGMVVFLHEMGHFLVAKRLGVKVERFAFGFGPEIFGFTRGETRYVIAWIPLGGEVRMSGEMMEDNVTDDPRAFFAQPWYRRFQIAIAGPVMNYVLAFVLFFFIGIMWGFPIRGIMIRNVEPGQPAAEAGLLPGDEIVGIGEEVPLNWSVIVERIQQSPGQALSLQVRRENQELTISVVPKVALSKSAGAEDPRPAGRGRIGIRLEPSPNVLSNERGFITSLFRSGEHIYFWTVTPLKYLGDKLRRFEAPEELSGPLGIAKIISLAARSGLRDFISIIAILSTAIGLFNLLPIPLLDGGHMAFYLWEGITGRPLNKKVFQAAWAVGLTLLLTLVLYATYKDIQRLRSGLFDAPVRVEEPAK